MLERIDDNPAFFRLALATQGVPSQRRLHGRRRARPHRARHRRAHPRRHRAGHALGGVPAPRRRQGHDLRGPTALRGHVGAGRRSPTRPASTRPPTSCAPSCSTAWPARPGLTSASVGGLRPPARTGPRDPGGTGRGRRAYAGARQWSHASSHRPSGPRRSTSDRGRPGPDGRRRPLLLRQHGGGVLVAAPPCRATGARRRATTSDATPWPAWPWGWPAWWPRSWAPSSWRPFTPGRGRYGKALVVGALGARRRRPSPTPCVAPTPPAADGPGAHESTPIGARPARHGGAPGWRRWVGSTPSWPEAWPSPPRGRRAPHRSGCGAGGSCPTSGTGAAGGGGARWRRGTSSTTGTTASCTPAATCGPSTWCTTRASTTTCPPRCASPWPRPSGPSCPSASLCLFGIRPGLVETARGVNLLYQYWIHTETVGPLGPAEDGPQHALAPPRAPRVEPPVPRPQPRQHPDPVGPAVRDLRARGRAAWCTGSPRTSTRSNPGRIATHEYAQMLRDVAASTSWRERLSYVVRGPGWANAHRAERAARRRAAAGARPARDRGPGRRLSDGGRPSARRDRGMARSDERPSRHARPVPRRLPLGGRAIPWCGPPTSTGLAGEGVRLARHYSQAAPCGPGRACLYTGTYQLNNRVVGNGTPLDFRFDNVARAARRAGYAPTVFGYADQGDRSPHGDGPRRPPAVDVPGIPAGVRRGARPSRRAGRLAGVARHGSATTSPPAATSALATEPDRPAEHGVSAFLSDAVIAWLRAPGRPVVRARQLLAPPPALRRGGALVDGVRPASSLAPPLPSSGAGHAVLRSAGRRSPRPPTRARARGHCRPSTWA